MEKKTIGTFIAALRKANGLTQKQLAAMNVPMVFFSIIDTSSILLTGLLFISILQNREKKDSPQTENHSRKPRIQRFTTLTGAFERYPRILFMVTSKIRCRASVGAQAMWGVMMQLGAVSRGLSERIGS